MINLTNGLPQIYKNGVAKVKATLEKEKPSWAALCMDGWSTFHHGYMGAVIS